MASRAFVFLRVDYSGSEDDFDEDEAMLQLLSFTGEIALKSGSSLRYVTANYDATRVDGEVVWLGDFLALRRDSAVTVERDDEGRVRTVESSSIDTEDARSLVAYFPARSLLLVQDRGTTLPFTRLITYLSAAAKARINQELGIELRLRPVRDSRAFEDRLREMERIVSVTVRFRHSQSPGVEAIDDRLDALDADSMTIGIRAGGDDGSLDPDALFDTDEREGQAIQHVIVNEPNGVVRARGFVGHDELPLASDRNELRKTVREPPDGDGRLAWAGALAGIVRGIQ